MSQKIVVIGAVALGPKAAARAKRLQPDSQVTMLDQGEFISYGGCGIPYYLSGDVGNIEALRQTTANVVRDPKFFKEQKGVDVLTQTRAIAINRQAKSVTVEDVQSGATRDLPYDKLVIATGSSPRVPPIAGADLDNVTTMTDLVAAKKVTDLLEAKQVSKAVVVGGGFIGLETAVALADMWNVETSVVELLDQLLPAQISPNLAAMVRHDLEEMGIKVYCGEKVTALEGQGKVSRLVTDKRVLDADLVIFSIGVGPNSDLAAKAGLFCHPRGGIMVNKHLQTNDPNIYAGGDCVVVPNLISGDLVFLPLGSMANRQGRVIGSNIAGGNETFDGVVGSWCVKLNKMNAAGTGLTEIQARQAGFNPVLVSIEQLDKAHFYPEKSMLSLEAVVDRDTRRVLGVQGFCADGLALKARVDAVAAMLQFSKPTLNDLSNLEVAYSPPFASAMDAINTLANVADNVLSDQYAAITPAEFANLWDQRKQNNYVFLDVRPSKASQELAQKYPGEWLAIPNEEFEQRVQEIPTGRPVALICNSGARAYETLLKLNQRGFTTFNSSGGMQAMKKMGQTF